jgi:hypothetical protein
MSEGRCADDIYICPTPAVDFAFSFCVCVTQRYLLMQGGLAAPTKAQPQGGP